MPFPKAIGTLLVLAAALSGGAAASVGAPPPVHATTASADVVLIRDTDVVSEDLYASGLRIDIRGVVQGDLVAAALGEVRISGTIEGDVLVVARSVVIEGEVRGSVRAITGTLTVTGSVDGDVVSATFAHDVSGTVGRDLLAATVRGALSGSIARDARIGALGSITARGTVGRDLEVNARTLTIGGEAIVDGDVRYRADATIADGARLSGLVVELGATPVPLRVRALQAAGTIVGIAIALLTGFGVMWLLGESVAASTRAARRWYLALLVGVGALAVPPVVLLVLPVVAATGSADLAAPLLLASMPLWLVYLGLLLVGLVIGWVPVAGAIGQAVFGRRSAHAHFVAGVILLAVVWNVPYVGPFALGLAWLVGVGGWLIGARSRRQIGTTERSDTTNTP
ncbi:MAG: hypothetical protein OEP52_10620, partial [Acidimicrobiia bacterium]|nr:hypothetical protein [Acidimicrobiia bacterium]